MDVDIDLSPKFPRTLIEEEGGAYYNWSSSDSAVLSQANVAAGKLVLKPRGFALPHYSDCSKIGYIVEGENGAAGMIFPDGRDKGTAAYIRLKRGDIIPVQMGSVSWWYNHGPSDLVIAFLGETSKAWFPGEITYFLLAGVQSNLGAFTAKTLGQAFDINAIKAKKMVTESQKGAMIIKLDEEKAKTFPVNSSDFHGTWTRSIENAPPDVAVENGGAWTIMTGLKFLFLEEVGLSAAVLKLENGAVLAPRYTADGTTQVFYVVKGSGRVEIVGLNGKLVLDDEVSSGQVFAVPKFFTVSMSAGGEGMECFSIITSPRPLIGELDGEDSMLNINPTVLQTSLNLISETTEQFKEKMEAGEIICPNREK